MRNVSEGRCERGVLIRASGAERLRPWTLPKPRPIAALGENSWLTSIPPASGCHSGAGARPEIRRSSACGCGAPPISTGARPFICALALLAQASEATPLKTSHFNMAHRLPCYEDSTKASGFQFHPGKTGSRYGISAPARFPIFERRIGLERLGEIEALPRGAAERGERGCKLDRLDSLGRRRHAERLGEAQHRANDRHCVGIDHHSRHEALVDLEHVDRQSLEIGEARIAG